MAEKANVTGESLPAKLTWDEFQSLVKRSEAGDSKSLGRLREALESSEDPSWDDWFTERHGNPSVWLKDCLGRSVGGEKDKATPEAVGRKMSRLQRELEGPAPTPLERLLAERVVFCWFAVGTAEALYASSKGLTIRQADFQLRRIDSANRRFLSAVATLARVRRLAVPSLQVNIGTNQVNVAPTGPES